MKFPSQMEQASKSWLLIHFCDVPPYVTNWNQTLFDQCCQYLTGKFNFQKQIIDLSPPRIHHGLGAIGSQGAVALFGSTGAQGRCDAIGWASPPTEQEREELHKRKQEEQRKKKEAREKATWRDLLNEVRKGKDHNPFLFENAQGLIYASCFILIEGSSLEAEVNLASFFLPFHIMGRYTNRQDAQADLHFEKRFGQDLIYQGPRELRTVIEWINIVTQSSIELPPYSFVVPDFETAADYQAFQHCEAQRRQQEKDDWDRKYRLSQELAIAPAECDITGEETTCVILEREDDRGYEYRTVISLDYLLTEAAKRELPFGNHKMS